MSTLTAQVRPWTTRISNWIPAWLANRPGFQFAFKFLWAHALMADWAVQMSLSASRAAWPGYDARTDNLVLLGQARQLVQGETEVDEAFAVRLQQWRSTATQRGGSIGLALNLHAWIAGQPAVTIIDRCNPKGAGALYTMVSTTGVVTQVYAPFNWDGTSNPERQGMWWDFWIVVFSAGVPSGFYVDDQGTWGASDSGAAWNLQSGWGHNSTPVENDTIRGLVDTWKGRHANCRAVVWCPNAALFQPATPSAAGNPDGTWGKWFNTATNQPSRNRTLRYWSLGGETS